MFLSMYRVSFSIDQSPTSASSYFPFTPSPFRPWHFTHIWRKMSFPDGALPAANSPCCPPIRHSTASQPIQPHVRTFFIVNISRPGHTCLAEGSAPLLDAHIDRNIRHLARPTVVAFGTPRRLTKHLQNPVQPAKYRLMKAPLLLLAIATLATPSFAATVKDREGAV